jgi:hypothetical protein
MKLPATRTTFITIIFCCAGATAASGDWNLRRNTSNGACSVQPVDSQPQLGVFLATFPTRKTACEERARPMTPPTRVSAPPIRLEPRRNAREGVELGD